MKLNVGIIGTGLIARRHMFAYLKHNSVRVKSIADENADRRERFSKEFAVPSVFADYEKILEDKSINVVDICLPHYLHYEVTMKSFSVRKDVILEKPIALTLEEADEIIETAKKSGCHFFVSLNQRFLPCHQKMKQLLEEGRIGKPFLTVGTIIGDEFSRMNDPANWKGTWEKAGGGVLADTGTHLVDIMQYLFGLPSSVEGTICERLVVEPEGKGDDNTLALLKFPHGVVCSLVLTYSATGNRWLERKEIFGTKGSICCSLMGQTPTTIYETSEKEKPLWVTTNKGTPEYIKVEHTKNWLRYSIERAVGHFIDCIVEEKEPFVNPYDARNALKTILSIYRIAKSSR